MASREWLKKRMSSSKTGGNKKTKVVINAELMYFSKLKNCHFTKEKRNI